MITQFAKGTAMPAVVKEFVMGTSMRCLGALVIGIATLGLAGCPPAPNLVLTPPAVTIGPDQTSAQFSITNGGGGVLQYTASENHPWLSLSLKGDGKQQGTITSTVSSGVDILELTVDKTQLPQGTTNGQVLIATNAGDKVLRVAVNVSGEAALRVSTNTLNFGATTDSAEVTISNAGSEGFEWTATVSQDAPWLTANPASGTITSAADTKIINVSVNRGTLFAGSYNGVITITSPAGNATINVNMLVTLFTAQPAQFNFGNLFSAKTLALTVANNSFDPLTVNITPATQSGGAWLSAAQPSLALQGRSDPGGSASIGITADPTGLVPGAYSGVLNIAQQGGGLNLQIPVTMQVTGFSVSTNLLALGTISQTTTTTFQVLNAGGPAIAYSIQVPPAAAQWLSVSPSSGNVTNADNITVTINPASLTPGQHEANLLVNYPGGTETIRVTLAKPRPATLQVEPDNINLGTTKQEELIGIWNPGIGTVNWSIDTTGFPTWLTLTPVNGAGIASGSVTGNKTDTVTIRADRTQIPPGQVTAQHTFNVTATGAATLTIPVTVRIEIPLIPRILLIAESVSETGIDFVNFDVNQDTETFTVRNDGNGKLDWRIAPETLPTWVSSVQPAQGSLDPGAQQTATITVSRVGQSYLGAQATATITSNDPSRPSLPLLLELQVAKTVAIGTRPSAIALGINVNSALLEVANTGDPDTLMNFQLTSTKNWLSVSPGTGSSVGTASAIKDFRPFSVTVDRSLLEGDGASGKIIVTAFEVRNGIPVPLPNVEPVEVEVTVQAAELTIETTPLPEVRVSSVVRFPMMMRNIRYQIIPFEQAFLPQLQQQFVVLENDIPLEFTETNQLIKQGAGYRGSVLIMLDYSGSMQAAATGLADPDIANALDPLQALYERTIPQLINSIPAYMRVGIAYFSERQPSNGSGVLRSVLGTAGEPAEQQSALFIRDRAALINRLGSIVVTDNGATQLLSAVSDGVARLVADDEARDLLHFDQTDFRSLICVTDGVITTPPEPLNAYLELLQGTRVRFYPIGWGSRVAPEALVALAGSSGGHFYSTRNIDTGQVDAFGTAIRRPVLSELEDWCVADLADDCDQSIGKDFSSLVTLSYITLNQQSNATIQGRLTFNDPTDQDGVCLPEQGEITGGFSSLPLSLASIAADNRLGQISLRSDGIRPDGTALVTARLEMAPRNVTQISIGFGVVGANPFLPGNVTLVTAPNGGVISDWNLAIVGQTITLTSPGPPLVYGDYGDMFTILITGAGATFRIDPIVFTPVLTTSPESKYFSIPDAFTVNAGAEAFAPSLPSPQITTIPEYDPITRVINLGVNQDTIQVTIRNAGGLHPPTLVGLFWQLQTGRFSLPLLPAPQQGEPFGTLYSNLDSATYAFRVDRSVGPGPYEADFFVEYTYNSIPTGAETGIIRVRYNVLPPNLAVSTNTLDFGAALNTLPLNITNQGQGLLNWNFFDLGFPSWLTSNSNSGTLQGGETFPLSLFVNRAGLPPGNYTHTFQIQTANPEDTEFVQVLITVP